MSSRIPVSHFTVHQTPLHQGTTCLLTSYFRLSSQLLHYYHHHHHYHLSPNRSTDRPTDRSNNRANLPNNTNLLNLPSTFQSPNPEPPVSSALVHIRHLGRRSRGSIYRVFFPLPFPLSPLLQPLLDAAALAPPLSPANIPGIFGV